MNIEKEQEEKNMIDLITSDELNNIYFNEFAIGVSKNDIFILLSRNGKAEAVLNASHITAKSFVSSLEQALKEFEVKTNQVIPLSDELEKLMDKNDDPKNH